MDRCGKIKLTYEGGLPIVWLTWGLRENGLVELCTVSLTNRHANYARAIIENEIHGESNPVRIPFVRCWIERRWAEHIFGMSLDENKEVLALAAMSKPRKGAKIPERIKPPKKSSKEQ